jgi:hypothetical protein
MKENWMNRWAAACAVVGILMLTGCFAKHTVAKLWTPDQANLETDNPAPSTGGNPGSATPGHSTDSAAPTKTVALAKGPVVPVTYRLVQPATAVDWSRTKVHRDIYHLERDVSKELSALSGLPANWTADQVIPKDEFETLEAYNQRIASMQNATGKTHYLEVKCDFQYNIDTKQFLVLPTMTVSAPVKAAPATTLPALVKQVNPVPPTPVVDQTAAVLDAYYNANALYNAGEFAKASQAYLDFMRKHPTHAKINHVQLGLALSHFSLGQVDTAEPWLERLSTNPNSPMPGTVKLLLEQCRAIRASGQKVKGGMVFELKLEGKPGTGSHRPKHQNECDPPAKPEPHEPATAPVATAASVGGLFRPWETPPVELTLLHQYEAHPAYFKTGVLHVAKIREVFEAEHKKTGRPGWVLPREYEPAIARALKVNLRLVAGCRLVRQPDGTVPGNYRDAFHLISLHVIAVDGNNRSIHYAADLKAAPTH